MLSVLCSACCKPDMITAICAKAMLFEQIEKLRFTYRGMARWFLTDEVRLLAEPIQAAKDAAEAGLQARRTAARDARKKRLPAVAATVPDDLSDATLKPRALLKDVLHRAELMATVLQAAELVFAELDCRLDARQQVLWYLINHPTSSARQVADALIYKSFLVQQLAESGLLSDFLTGDDKRRLCAAVPAFAVHSSLMGAELRQTVEVQLQTDGLTAYKGHTLARRAEVKEQYVGGALSLEHAVETLVFMAARAESALADSGYDLTPARTGYIQHYASCSDHYTVQQFLASL